MGRLCWVAILATTGCSAVFGLGDPQPAPPDGPPASCLIAGFDLCAHQQPNGPIRFGSDTLIDTTLDCNVVLFDPNGGSVCVIYATDLTVTATVKAHGARPLVLAATGTITIDGTVDASSSRVTSSGPGANNPACAVKQESGTTSGGSAGGSFHGKGGNGGAGTSASQNAAGTPSDAIDLPASLRGGCSGGITGFNSGGAGGGGVLIVASSAIAISMTGRVLAGGAGGRAGSPFEGLGGAGGGSGGLIEIIAPMISIAGVIAANGGGGGEGADVMGGMQGMPGADAIAGTTIAKGGAGTTPGGDGGDGGAGAILAATNATAPSGANLGGGGGGGGAGFIVLTSPALVTTGATISPPAS